MKKGIKFLFLILLIISSIIIGWKFAANDNTTSFDTIETAIKRPLDKYTIENLSKADIKPGNIEVEETLFSFEFNPNLDGKTKKITTGQINLPSGNGPFPVVVMLRGYINQETYSSGDGTRRVADFLSQNGFISEACKACGFITIAPDFLGYGGSDEEADNIFETRFQTYTTVLSLIKSLDQIDNWDKDNIFLWGHSNGGQIALTILEITEESYPTVLWAPVSKQFPYSILYYTDQSEDRGKLIRNELSKFEENYNADLYSLDLYLDRITAPIQIHQGLMDDAVPVSWSDQLVKKLLNLNLDIEYYKYPGADHNMNPSWETIVKRDLDFFKNNLD